MEPLGGLAHEGIAGVHGTRQDGCLSIRQFDGDSRPGADRIPIAALSGIANQSK